jgi:transposase
MTLYIGVDIHARQQTLSYLDTSDGTTGQVEILHERDDIREYYSQFEGEVIIGIEACGYTNWFEELMEELGHKLVVGDAAEIRRLARRRQKNDRRDADLLLELLVHDEFPRLFRYSKESREVLRQLRYRHKLVKLRTMVVNTLHALAINAGLSLRAQLLTKGGRKQLAGLQLSAISQQQRDELVSLADELTRRIQTVEQWLQVQAKSDERVQRLQTHPGVGLLTSLCLVHTLGDLNRFSSTRKVAAYVGFDPMEDSSAERKASAARPRNFIVN